MSNTRDSNEYVNLSNKSIDDIAKRVIYEQNRMDEDKDNTYGMMIYCALFLIHIIDLFWLVYFCTFLVTVYM